MCDCAAEAKRAQPPTRFHTRCATTPQFFLSHRPSATDHLRRQLERHRTPMRAQQRRQVCIQPMARDPVLRTNHSRIPAPPRPSHPEPDLDSQDLSSTPQAKPLQLRIQCDRPSKQRRPQKRSETRRRCARFQVTHVSFERHALHHRSRLAILGLSSPRTALLCACEVTERSARGAHLTTQFLFHRKRGPVQGNKPTATRVSRRCQYLNRIPEGSASSVSFQRRVVSPTAPRTRTAAY